MSVDRVMQSSNKVRYKSCLVNVRILVVSLLQRYQPWIFKSLVLIKTTRLVMEMPLGSKTRKFERWKLEFIVVYYVH